MAGLETDKTVLEYFLNFILKQWNARNLIWLFLAFSVLWSSLIQEEYEEDMSNPLQNTTSSFDNTKNPNISNTPVSPSVDSSDQNANNSNIYVSGLPPVKTKIMTSFFEIKV